MTPGEKGKVLADWLGIELNWDKDISIESACFVDNRGRAWKPFSDYVHFENADIMIGRIIKGLVAKGFNVKQHSYPYKKISFHGCELYRKGETFHRSAQRSALQALAGAAYLALKEATK